MKRFASLFAAAGAVAAISAFALAGGAGAASSLPTLNIALSGKTGISVSGGEVSGAVNVVATHTGAGAANASFALVRVNPNTNPSVEIPAAFQAVGARHGDENALTARGDAVLVSANAPSTVQTVLTPGTWVALNDTSMGKPGFQVFQVSNSSSPAALPAAAATSTAIDFGFKGPSVLHNGSVVRAVNGGFLVHMNDLIGVKSKAAGQKLVTLLRAGAPMKKLRPFFTKSFVSLMDPASPGALQQMVLNTKPGFYVEACFMNTQDGREHTQLGMERLVKVVK
jgi:hypothetical protein